MFCVGKQRKSESSRVRKTTSEYKTDASMTLRDLHPNAGDESFSEKQHPHRMSRSA